MNKKRILFGAFWFFNIFIGVSALYLAVAVQFNVLENQNHLDALAMQANGVGDAFLKGYQQGLLTYKNVAIQFFKTYGVKLALFAFIFAGTGTWLGWLPGTKPIKNL